MKVFKFGGASVKDAAAVRNMADIILSYANEQLLVVISAMGKTTNLLEKLLHSFYFKDGAANDVFSEIKEFHFAIARDLFPDSSHPVYEELHNAFLEIEWQIEDEPVGTYDFEYDQMVGIGEIVSTKIVSAYLKEVACQNTWMDARGLIRTDNQYRNATVDWTVSAEQIKEAVKPVFSGNEPSCIVTQGFIGGTSENFSSTLGREGSDYTAAVFANILDAEEVIIWKDVPGMLNADPKFFTNTIKLNNISYREAVELAYYGASVIHPKTIKPLQNKAIPLYVKSFLNPLNKGTLINENDQDDSIIPSYIHKTNQRLISIAPKDFSFMTELNMSRIFQLFSDYGVVINIMQNSAISFSVGVDENELKLNHLIEELQMEFKVTYNTSLTLLTIRHYNEDIIGELIEGKKVLLEQKSRVTARFIYKV